MNNQDHKEREPENVLALAIHQLSHVIHDAAERVNHNNNQAVLNRLAQLERIIMSALGDQTARFDAALTSIGAAVDEVITAQAGISGVRNP